MAIDAHSTTAPAVQPGLLRTWAGAVPVPTPDLTAETVAMLDGLASEFPPAPIPSLVSLNLRRRHLNESQRAMAAAKLANMKSGDAASQRQPHEMIDENDGVEISTPCISQREAADLLNVSRSTVTEAKKVLDAGTAETVAMLDAIPADVVHGEAPICSAADLPCGDIPTTDLAQARHMRRALEGALDHGTALLAALGLPRLMEPGFVPLDPAAIGDALDTAIATLDALDAAGMDLEDDGTAEPWLGWIDGKPVLSDSHDDREAEDDDEPMLGAPERHPSCYQFALCDATSSQAHWADGSARHDEAEAVNEDGGDILDEGEETLGWAANVGQLALGQTTADSDETALDRHGRGFLRSGPDDSEDDDPAGAQQRDEDALFWSIDVGCTIGSSSHERGANV